MNDTIEIQNAGPIDVLRFQLPESGGIVVFEGRNGSGKSNALEATKALLGQEGEIAVRDTADRATVSGLGVNLTLRRRMTTDGTVEVGHLEGPDLSKIVDPGIDNEGAADAARLRSLAKIAGVSPNVDLFRRLVPGLILEQVVDAGAFTKVDIVDMAGAMKRGFEKRAGALEDESTLRANDARTLRDSVKDLPAEGGDPAAIDEEIGVTHRGIAHLEGQMQAWSSAQEARAKARACLDGLGDSGSEQSVLDAAAEVARAKAGVTACQESIEALKAKLAAAEEDRRVAIAALNSATHIENLARMARESRRDVEAVLQGQCDEQVGTELHAQVSSKRSWLQMLQENRSKAEGAQRRRQTEAKADAFVRTANECREQALVLRNAAAGCEGAIVESLLHACPDGLTIRQGRMRLRTDRGDEYFSELSKGERYRWVIQVAARLLAARGQRGIVVLNQEGWEGLDPEARQFVHGEAVQANIVIVTAQCSSGPLRAIEFSPTEQES